MADRISIVRNSFWFPFGTKIYSSELNSWDHRTLVVCTDGKWCGCYCCCCYCFLNQKKKRRERERVEMKFRLRWWWWWWWSSPEITQSDRERGVVGRNGQSVVLSEEEGDGQGGKKSSCVCVCLFVSSLFFFFSQWSIYSRTLLSIRTFQVHFAKFDDDCSSTHPVVFQEAHCNNLLQLSTTGLCFFLCLCM